MHLIAPDILSEARGLSPALSGVGALVGLLLWLFGWRWHRFWVVAAVTLAAAGLVLALLLYLDQTYLLFSLAVTTTLNALFLFRLTTSRKTSSAVTQQAAAAERTAETGVKPSP